MQRIFGYDLARALAIFGMIFVNFKTVMHVGHDDEVWWLSMFNLLDGRASAVFVVLAGIGLSLMTQQARLSGDQKSLQQTRTTLLKRAAFLFVIGLLYLPIWPADILHYYGVYIAIGALLLELSSRCLLWLSIALAAGFSLLFAVLDYSTAWNWSTLSYADLWSPLGFLRNLFFNGFHPVFPWAGFLIFGMALGRLPMQQAKTRQRVFFAGLLVCLLIEVLVFGIRQLLLQQAYAPDLVKYLFSTTPMPPLPLYFLSALASACALIALCVEVAECYHDSVYLLPLIHTGQLALTLYLAHVVLGMGVLEALGYLKQQSLAMALSCALIFCVVATIFASYWRNYFKLGPLEYLLRKATGSA